jgi:Uncharacterized protein involved in tolerance to divalent cations
MVKTYRCIMVFVTVPNKKIADKIIKQVLTGNLAACVNVSKSVDSFYWWDEKIRHSKEFVLMMKTVENKFKILSETIRNLHPYKVPEIISVNISGGNKDYLDWIKKYAG